jgi:hypothetical protein
MGSLKVQKANEEANDAYYEKDDGFLREGVLPGF